MWWMRRCFCLQQNKQLYRYTDRQNKRTRIIIYAKCYALSEYYWLMWLLLLADVKMLSITCVYALSCLSFFGTEISCRIKKREVCLNFKQRYSYGHEILNGWNKYVQCSYWNSIKYIIITLYEILVPPYKTNKRYQQLSQSLFYEKFTYSKVEAGRKHTHVWRLSWIHNCVNKILLS